MCAPAEESKAASLAWHPATPDVMSKQDELRGPHTYYEGQLADSLYVTCLAPEGLVELQRAGRAVQLAVRRQ